MQACVWSDSTLRLAVHPCPLYRNAPKLAWTRENPHSWTQAKYYDKHWLAVGCMWWKVYTMGMDATAYWTDSCSSTTTWKEVRPHMEFDEGSSTQVACIGHTVNKFRKTQRVRKKNKSKYSQATWTPQSLSELPWWVQCGGCILQSFCTSCQLQQNQNISSDAVEQRSPFACGNLKQQQNGMRCVVKVWIHRDACPSVTTLSMREMSAHLPGPRFTPANRPWPMTANNKIQRDRKMIAEMEWPSEFSMLKRRSNFIDIAIKQKYGALTWI